MILTDLPHYVAAPANMPDMLTTSETSQPDISPLNSDSPNMRDMSVTEETSQEEKLPLNERAPANMLDMSMTLERFDA